MEHVDPTVGRRPTPLPLEGEGVGGWGGGTVGPIAHQDSDGVSGADPEHRGSTPTQPSPLEGEGSRAAASSCESDQNNLSGEGHVGPDGFHYDRFQRQSKIRPGGIKRARRPRAEPTRAEERLWPYLSRLPLRFRRQAPIGRFTVDFVCHRARLIIELDGGIHDLPEVAARDVRRQAELEREGYGVLRFANKQVSDDVEAVVRTIRGAHPLLAEVEASSPVLVDEES